MKPQLGLIGIVKEEMQQDLPGTLRRLRELGYRGIESGAALLESHGGPAELARIFADADMTLISVFSSVKDLTEGRAQLIDNMKTAGCANAILGWSAADSKEAIAETADLCNEAGAALREAGLTLCYHNHEQEFRNTLSGRVAMDQLLKQTEPEDLKLELDVAWAAVGGVNPVAFLERHADRIPLVHMKDVYDLTVRGCFAAPGTGVVDIKGCLDTATRNGADWVIVEQDKPRNIRGLDLATAAALNLRDLGLKL
jgi:sugar phosphate isomerase/epimerase